MAMGEDDWRITHFELSPVDNSVPGDPFSEKEKVPRKEKKRC